MVLWLNQCNDQIHTVDNSIHKLQRISENWENAIKGPIFRASEHVGRLHRTVNLLKTPAFSAIREHSKGCSKTVKLEDFKILGSEKSLIPLRILESLYIKQLKPKLNDFNSAFPLVIA